VLLEYDLSRGEGEQRRARWPARPGPSGWNCCRRCASTWSASRIGAAPRELGLHPNTIDNRLAKAGALIGVDLTLPRGYTIVLTALAPRELRPGEPD
jgi:hypothetical protein